MRRSTPAARPSPPPRERSVCLLVRPSVRPIIHLCVFHFHLLFVCPVDSLSVCPLICVSPGLFALCSPACQSNYSVSLHTVSLSTYCPTVCLSTYSLSTYRLPTCLSVCLSVCMSGCLSAFLLTSPSHLSGCVYVRVSSDCGMSCNNACFCT